MSASILSVLLLAMVANGVFAQVQTIQLAAVGGVTEHAWAKRDTVAAHLLHWDAVVVNQIKALGIPLWVAHLALTVLAGISVAVMIRAWETAVYKCCTYLEKTGRLHRFTPSLPGTMVEQPWLNFVSLFVNQGSLIGVLLYYRHEFMAKAVVEFAPLQIWLSIVAFMYGADTLGFWYHHLVHANKRLFMAFHHTHHMGFGNMTVFAATNVEIVDMFFGVVAFHWVAAFFVYNYMSSFNLLVVPCLVFVGHNHHIFTHAGYHISEWAHNIFTLGTGALPFSSTSKYHFIHHVDPRSNKGLYFVHWDMFVGCFKADHKCIVPVPNKKVE